MIYVKTAIVTTLLILCLLVGYMFFKFDSDYAMNAAFDSFSKGQYDQALKQLQALRDTAASDQVKLYEGYVYRAKKQWTESNEAFNQALSISRKRHQPTVLLEIYLNQALNGYLQDQATALSTAVSNAAEVSPQDPWVELFKGIEAYKQGKYSKALEIWSQPIQRLPYSRWMHQTFDSLFDERWLSLQIARCQIETGKYLAARHSLETELKTDALHANEIQFLIGLRYVKEAQEKPPNAAAPYYKLAFSYFGKVPMQQERYAPEQQQILEKIQTTIQSLIRQNNFADLPFYASILEGWNAQEGANAIKQQLLALLSEQIQVGQLANIKDLTALLNRILPEGEEREKLQQQFEHLATQSLAAGEIQQAHGYWEITHLFSRDPSLFDQRFASKVSSKVIEMLPNADPSLSSIMPYVVFWQTIEQDPARRLAFATQLVAQAHTFLMEGETQPKGLAIMKLAFSLPDTENQATLRKNVEETLTKNYETALTKQDIDRLPLILTTIQNLDLSGIDLHKDQQITQHLATAQQLINEKIYDQAMKHAKWVLALDRDNQPARLIAGRIFYDQSNYVEALNYLSGIPAPDLDILEAVAVSQTLTKHTQEGLNLFTTIKKKRPLKTESLIRLGLGNLIQGNIEAGREWLSKVKNPDSEVYAGLAYAALREGKWKESLELYDKITPPYNDLEGLQGLAIRAEIGLGEDETAEHQLTELLAKRTSPSVNTFSPPFQKFPQFLLNQYNRYVIAAIFFREIKKDNITALKYLNMDKYPSTQTLFLKGLILLDLNRPTEAVNELEIAVNKATEIEDQQLLIPILAKALHMSGQELEALNWYRKFFALDPTNLSYRDAYAQLLMTLLRHDLAAEQYAILTTKGSLTPTQTMSYITSLTLKGSFDEAISYAEQVLKPDSGWNLTQQLEVARMMIIANNQEAVLPLVKRLPSVDKLSADEMNALIQLLIETGSYDQATQLVSQYRDLLSTSSQHLLTIADLFIRVDQKNEALKAMQASLKLDPKNPEALKLVRRYSATTQRLLESLQSQKNELDKGTANLTSTLNYVKTLDSAVRLDAANAEKLQADLRSSVLILNKLGTEVRGVPEIDYLKGEMQRFLNNRPAALEAYLAAGRLAPSYSDALFELGKLYRNQSDEKRAISVYYQVTRYAPDNAAAWQALAELYALDGYLFEASNFYQNAIKFRPNEISNYLALANVYLELRDPEEAKTTLDHAAKLEPNNIDVLKLLLTTLMDNAFSASLEDPKAVFKEQQSILRRLQALAPEEAEKFARQLSLFSNTPGLNNNTPDLNSNPLFVPNQ